MNYGFIYLWRKTIEKGWYTNSKYVHLWVHILLSVNHEAKEFLWNGRSITIKPGQFITGRKELSTKTGISGTTIERILRTFESEHQIGQQKTNKYRLITVKNWVSYQSARTAKRTTDGQQTDTNNNDNNDNKKIQKPSPIGDSHMFKEYKEPTIDSDTGELIQEPKKTKKPVFITFPRCYEIWQKIAEQQEKSGVAESSRLPYHQSFTFGFSQAYKIAKKKGYGDAEIEHAVKVYASVLESPKSYWTKRYNFSEFMKYAYEKFIGKQPRDFAGKIK